jgi:DNA topoisomerase IA
MPHILHVAEKPSVAKEIARILNGGAAPERRVGRSPYNPVWVFRGDLGGGPLRGAQEHRVASVSGHLTTLDFEPPFNTWSSCSPAALFTAPLRSCVPEDKEPLAATLREHAAGAAALVLWLDCDREGEGIAFEVIEVTRVPAPRVHRARFSSLVPADVQRAARALGKPDQRAADAVTARTELDLRIGAALTRLQTLALKHRFEELAAAEQPISYGPCQTATLGFVVERYEAIRAFVSERFWTIHVSVQADAADGGVDGEGEEGGGRRGGGSGGEEEEEEEAEEVGGAEEGGGGDGGAGGGGRGGGAAGRRGGRLARGARPRFDDGARGGGRGGGQFPLSWSRTRLFDQLCARVLWEKVAASAAAGGGVVVSVQTTPARKARPLPMTTRALQTSAARFLRLPSDRALALAEELYTAGFVSYPRTETEAFPPGKDLAALVRAHEGHSDWGASARALAGGGFQWPRAGAASDEAHEPIHPVKCGERGDVPAGTYALYELIVRHFLAACSGDAVGAATRAEVEFGGEAFSGSGLVVSERGWLGVYPWARWGGGPPLPRALATAGARVAAAAPPALRGGSTQPPPLLSEVDLIEAMAEHGIGTDSTTAAHIATIRERRFAVRSEEGMRFTPTTLGGALIAAYGALGLPLGKPWLRANMEAAFADVAGGRRGRRDVVAACLAEMKPVYAACLAGLPVFIRAMEAHLAPLGRSSRPPAAPAHRAVSTCGVCGGAMQLRAIAAAAGGEPLLLLFCAPCAKGWPLPRGAEGAVPTPHTCPLCNYQVVSVAVKDAKKGGGGGGGGGGAPLPVTMCPKCFSEPPAEHHGGVGGDAGDAPLVRMPCGRCTAPGCALARGGGGAPRAGAAPEALAAAAVFPCGGGAGRCKGGMQLRQGREGGWRLSCDGGGGHLKCDRVAWLPRAVTRAAVSAGEPCGRCSEPARGLAVRLLEFTFAADGTVPEEMVAGPPLREGSPFTFRGCVLCAPALLSLEVRFCEKGAPVAPPSRAALAAAALARGAAPPPPQPPAAPTVGGAVGAPRARVEVVLEEEGEGEEELWEDFFGGPPPPPKAANEFLMRPPPKAAAARAAAAAPPAHAQPPPDAAARGAPCPTCSAGTALRTSSSEKNPGRQFWACAGAAKCGFVGWADGGGAGWAAAGGGGGGGGGAGKRPTADDAGGAPQKKKRAPQRCGRCKQLGHNKSHCPLAGEGGGGGGGGKGAGQGRAPAMDW